MKNSFKSFISLLLVAVILSSLNFSVRADDKLKPEEIVAKNLDSIGTKEKRAEIKDQTILCDLQLQVSGNTTPVNGRAVIASAGDKTLWGMTLASNDYPSDTYSYNGKETKVAFVTPGARSRLGEFIYNYRELLKEGLLGGTLSSAWALAYTDTRKPKLSYDGEKKIDGKDTYVLGYSPKSGSDLKIKMYFDKQTFQHVRTEYNRVIAATQAATGQGEARINASAGQGSDRYSLIEEFSDFQAINGMTMPKTYKLTYKYYSDTVNQSQSNQKKNTEVTWKFNVVNASFNQQLDPNSFEIQGK